MADAAGRGRLASSGNMEPHELARAMVKLGIVTDAALAKRLGVHRSTVGRWLTGDIAIGRAWAMVIRAQVKAAGGRKRKEI